MTETSRGSHGVRRAPQSSPRRLVRCVRIGIGVAALVPAALVAQQADSAFRASVAAIARRQAVDDVVGAPGARSILLTDGAPTPRAIVLLHGLTDSPRQFERLAYLLYGDGYNVYVPRLPEHGLRGRNVRVLSKLTAAKLRSAADSITTEAMGLGDSVIVVGLSMGGTMAAWIAQEREVQRVVLVAPAIEPGRIPSMLDRPLIGLADRLPAISRRSPADSARPDREPGFDLQAAAQLFSLGLSVLHGADVRAPRTQHMVLLVNAADRTVKASAAESLARAWARHGAAVAVYELPDSLRLPHNIIDPLHGRVGGDAVLMLLRALAYGQPPGPLVRAPAGQ